jgi:hypothetical protein
MPTWVLRTITAVRRVPWAKLIVAVTWLATEGREYWSRLTAPERREVRDLLVKSRGRRSNLSNAELGRLIDLLDKVRRGPDESVA